MLRPMVRNVLLFGPVPIDAGVQALAAVLAFEPWAVLSHQWAAHELGLVPEVGEPVQVTVVGRHPGAARGIEVHRLGHLHADEAWWSRKLPVTSPARTLLDIARDGACRDLEVVLGTALAQHGSRRSQIEELLRRHAGRPGVARLRTLLEIEGGPLRTRSEAERRYAGLIRQAGLPPPETNAMVLGRELDAFWRDAAVAVEIDSFEFHGSREAFEADRRRDAALKAAGIEVLRFTWRRITREPLAVVAETAQVLASRQTAQR